MSTWKLCFIMILISNTLRLNHSIMLWLELLPFAVWLWWYIFNFVPWWWCLGCVLVCISCCWFHRFYPLGEYPFIYVILILDNIVYLSYWWCQIQLSQFPKLMEVVGLGYTVWFTSRYLIFKVRKLISFFNF